MPVTMRTSALLAAVILAGFGLTACQKNEPAAGAPAPATTVTANPTTAPKSTVTKPADLPAGLPLPSGDLTSVTGGAGAYVLAYRTADPAADLASYEAALKGDGYDVVAAAGTVTALKGAVSLVITTTPTTVTVAVSGS
ncbi:hypothetical protein GCM10010193_13790 [Kitasatospora atroaurantiaca]|uniref:Uncharacterized protein n=1 Tax=Kitasatospora atroaurantiaca TaxID=285545 RepID=A0A561ESY1_9ACTN|nr:hypothetical protein [Kitasatospora atroaurantiaca]TWE18713.1 hypothetical protein FB465_3801 [Kitasatospora atroaurantiaca]